MSTATAVGTAGRVGRFRRFTGRTVDWTLLLVGVGFLFAGHVSTTVHDKALSTGNTVLTASLDSRTVDPLSALSLARDVGTETAQSLLVQFVAALLLVAFVYDLLLTHLIGATPGKLLMASRLQTAAGRPRLTDLPRTAARSFLAVVPGGLALLSWMLWLGGLHLSATVALLVGGSFFLVDGLFHLVTGQALHDRLTGVAVTGLSRPASPALS